MTATVYHDIAYGTDALQGVDIYVPSTFNYTNFQGVPPKGVIIWIHGGGWSGGDKSTETVPAELGNLNYIVINANYRLTAASTQDPVPTGFFPNDIVDIKTILKFCLVDGAGATQAPMAAQSVWATIRSLVKQYGLFVSGASAGGHLSIISTFEYALDTGGLWPNGVLSIVGPMNLYSSGPLDPSNPIGTTGIGIINTYTQNNVTNVQLASPYYRFATYKTIPNYYTSSCKFYFWYNTNDTLVPTTAIEPFVTDLAGDLSNRVSSTVVTEGTPILGSGGYPTQYNADHWIVSDLGPVVDQRASATFRQGLTYPRQNQYSRPVSGLTYPRSAIYKNLITPITLSPNSGTNTKLGNGNIKLTNGVVGSSYSQTFSATGGVGPYTYSNTKLPAGLGLSTAGVLSGTPTVQGYYYFTVTVRDSLDQIGSITYQLTVTGNAVTFTPAVLPIGDFTAGHNDTSFGTQFNEWYDYSCPGIGAGVGTQFNVNPEGGVVINREGTYVYVLDEVLWAPDVNGFVKPTGTDLQSMINYWKLQGKGSIIAVTPATELISHISTATIWAEAQRADVIALDPYLLSGFIGNFNSGDTTINQTNITNTINGLIAWTQSWITLAQSGGKQVILITQGIVEPSLSSYVGQYLTAQYSTFTRSQIKQRVVFGIDLINSSEQGSYVAVDVTPYQTAYPL